VAAARRAPGPQGRGGQGGGPLYLLLLGAPAWLEGRRRPVEQARVRAMGSRCGDVGCSVGRVRDALATKTASTPTANKEQ